MYLIIDWANNICFDGITFDTQEDAFEFLYQKFPEDTSDIDDYYVVPVGGNYVHRF